MYLQSWALYAAQECKRVCPNYERSYANTNKHSNIKLTNKPAETIKIFIYKKVEILFAPTKWLWPTKFKKSRIFKFLISLTKTDKKLHTKNFRMIVQVVWKIYKKMIGSSAFLLPISTIGLRQGQASTKASWILVVLGGISCYQG